MDHHFQILVTHHLRGAVYIVQLQGHFPNIGYIVNAIDRLYPDILEEIMAIREESIQGFYHSNAEIRIGFFHFLFLETNERSQLRLLIGEGCDYSEFGLMLEVRGSFVIYEAFSPSRKPIIRLLRRKRGFESP